MPKNAGENAKDVLIREGTDLLRRQGYMGTSVDEICTAAGVTKGAFFHYFESKEALAVSCLESWPATFGEMMRTAPFQTIDDPAEKLLAAIDFISKVFQRPDVQKSCLAGTTVQEVSETNPVLRDAAQSCFAKGQAFFQSMLDEACRSRGVKLDTASLANHCVCTMQGALLLWKASRNDAVIRENFQHLRNYLESLLTSK